MGPYLIYSHSIPYKQGAIPIKQGESAAFKVEWEKVTHKKNTNPRPPPNKNADSYFVPEALFTCILMFSLDLLMIYVHCEILVWDLLYLSLFCNQI